MIKFFRKIRYDLMEKNKTGKYLKYAIGEIALVMVGILLALQVNNWNTNKALTKKEIVKLNEISKNLTSDLENQLIPGIAYYQRAQESYGILQSNFLNSAQSIPEDSIRTLYFRTTLAWKLVFNTVAFDNLNSIGVDLITNDTIRENISQFYGNKYKEIMNYHNITILELREDFVPLLNNNVNMFKSLSKSELNYLKNDVGINSRLVAMSFRKRFLIDYFLDAKSMAEQLIVDIKNEIVRLEN